LKKRVALIGNPNSGKTTLFNGLTGLNQRVGNFPGVTVDKKVGRFTAGGTEVELIDLPGTYSLFPKSLDERLTFEVLCDPTNEAHPDINLIVADSSNLERSLYLATQVIQLGIPAVLILNMDDVSQKMGVSIDTEKLGQYLGVPVIRTNARSRASLQALHGLIDSDLQPSQKELMPMAEFKPDVLAQVAEVVEVNGPYAAFQVACNYSLISYFDRHPDKAETIQQILKEAAYRPYTMQARESQIRYGFINDLVPLVEARDGKQRIDFTSRLDDVLTHRIWGFVIFIGVLFLIFQALFTWAEKPMEWIEGFFAVLSQQVATQLPPGMLSDLLTEGVIAGLGGVLVFVPQIAFLFLFIGFLEDTGYMARAGVIVDSFLRRFGMNGRSVIPMVGGFACAIPAIMATRSISNWRERLITMLVTPFISCSARLPVYTLLISLVIPSDLRFLGLQVQGLTLLALYLAGIFMALAAGWVLKRVLKTDMSGTFVMEMPTYKWPDLRTLLLTIWEKLRVFIWDAGRIIVAISIVLWFLSSFGPGGSMEEIDQALAQTEQSFERDQLQSQRLEQSYAGVLGRTIEPVIRPLGYDWKIGIALITSFAAREVFVGTLATLFSVGDPDDTTTLREKMALERHRVSGAPTYGLATGLSLMVFYAFAMQCMSTIAVVKRETGGWKWPVIQAASMSVIAYLFSFLVYQGMMLFS